jgi:hypothetical protein
MQNDETEKQNRKKLRKTIESTRVNSTNPPLMTWDRDKKKIDFQTKNLKKRLKLNKKNIELENVS